MAFTKLLQKLAGVDQAKSRAMQVTVLLVDDQAEVAEVMQELLQESGYTVIATSNATSALDVLATNPEIDIVVSDVVMPGELGGADIAEFAKEMAGIPTILVSGYPHHRITQESLGKYDVVLKPFLIEELDEQIQNTLARA
ncbi:response regulator [Parasphingopyxis lamellibrachiae]|uniref:Response regulator receiver domain-containing protein n=1 Tax=Parasphingopyxis lamellibrachiae TaxID=680125 RepID=A0A3D9FD49_9SPHN|nr:response regulator [Parasphingopyxis lamellibrachiae]RED15750.1 response regulator receiver domain-containing protein [Parasphingopyxis lamellibrachiae]